MDKPSLSLDEALGSMLARPSNLVTKNQIDEKEASKNETEETKDLACESEIPPQPPPSCNKL